MTRFETAVLLLLLAILRRLEASIGMELNSANQGREERAKQFAANLINESDWIVGHI